MNRHTSFKIGSIHGIEIRLDLSVAIVFLLVVYSLGSGLFPSWHADWSIAESWSTALAAGLLFFASLLAHELAHSVVAQARGIEVPRITLFVFGGVSEMQREPDTPASELLIAIVGPATSLVLGAVFTGLGVALAGDSLLPQLQSDPEAALASLGQTATLLLWLGPVNIVLGVFNLIPGFPLDGGRVFRALAWWLTGSLERATRWAANAGRGFAWGLIALGLLELLNGRLFQGIWFMLIGWFLQNAARSSQVQLAVRQALAGLKVRDLMRTRFETVSPQLSLRAFVDERLLRSGQLAWPVVDGGELVGMIAFDDLRGRLEGLGAQATVGQNMRNVEEYLRPEAAGRDALEILLRSSVDPLPVLEHGHIVGMLFRADIMRWLAVHQLNTGL